MKPLPDENQRKYTTNMSYFHGVVSFIWLSEKCLPISRLGAPRCQGGSVEEESLLAMPPGATCVPALPPGGTLAEPPHARLLPSSHLLALTAGRHAGRRHQLLGIHLGE